MKFASASIFAALALSSSIYAAPPLKSLSLAYTTSVATATATATATTSLQPSSQTMSNTPASTRTPLGEPIYHTSPFFTAVLSKLVHEHQGSSNLRNTMVSEVLTKVSEAKNALYRENGITLTPEELDLDRATSTKTTDGRRLVEYPGRHTFFGILMSAIQDPPNFTDENVMAASPAMTGSLHSGHDQAAPLPVLDLEFPQVYVQSFLDELLRLMRQFDMWLARTKSNVKKIKVEPKNTETSALITAFNSYFSQMIAKFTQATTSLSQLLQNTGEPRDPNDLIALGLTIIEDIRKDQKDEKPFSDAVYKFFKHDLRAKLLAKWILDVCFYPFDQMLKSGKQLRNQLNGIDGDDPHDDGGSNPQPVEHEVDPQPAQHDVDPQPVEDEVNVELGSDLEDVLDDDLEDSSDPQPVQHEVSPQPVEDELNGGSDSDWEDVSDDDSDPQPVEDELNGGPDSDWEDVPDDSDP
ncbi:hypothetical protein BATDEDRAFT_28939 [Batrachochytrium dendrobatidis JAM81]|uniref:Uncharacterized protein n=1 Tax=Batrachochytrium dendrobatidis (strain JAM81 / FGSC 10211) TaxID=684364 RepID=F4PFP3_BATDJ|nr:uncharacterized protein BATDEDRAFT_28939 [Batrachochytrium dendrobatidis JAM81]EGF75951.1 hypothetical protein BATDEDRAFT_28939 [Batrachochytrium dendrobatidis JAM81]|eukprot:XP_006683426.1 hypothetical protein BATDEDRAFT_28939 [Batrachochytrium dendrobatidis JAM81]